MKIFMQVAALIYSCLIRLYPQDYRRLFADEMCLVFEEVIQESAGQGFGILLFISLRELFSLPISLLSEYVHNIQRFISGLIVGKNVKTTTGGNMVIKSFLQENNGFQTRRHKILAVLPPLLFASGLALMWLVMAGNQWYEVPHWRLLASVVVGMLPNVMIFLGAVVAVFKKLPAWGYTWLGSLLLGLVLLLQTVSEELIENGFEPISGAGETIIGIVLLLGFLLVFGVLALRGWWQAGLASIGMVSMIGLSICHTLAVPPINQQGLVYISIPMALLTAFLIYVYIEGKTFHKIMAFIVVEILNAGLALIAGNVYGASRGLASGPYPVLPLISIMTLILVLGPVMGVLITPLRRTLKSP